MSKTNTTQTSCSTSLLDLLTEMKKQSNTEQQTNFQPKSPSNFSSECWFDDACILDMDYFVKTLSGIKAKGVRADLIGSIITHYASKWLPDLSTEKGLTQFEESSPESVTASWMKKRFFVETLVNVLPPEKDSIPCNFLLRLLRTANMVNVDVTYKQELEKRVSWQLDQASLKELVIPSFSHTCGTLLDVELVIRLVKRFVSLDNEGAKSGAALVKVAKLVDCYLAEAAVDANLSLSEFVTLAGVLPSHARATDDGLYRAIDTYLKAHSNVSKQERKGLCRLIDCRKLTQEASLHAAQNERFPVRAVIQVLLSEQTKLNRHNNHQMDWSGSIMSITRSPTNGFGLEAVPTARCLSKREMNIQQMEIKKLKEDVHRLQSQCNTMQVQMERMVEKKKGFFKWSKRFSVNGFGKGDAGVVVERRGGGGEEGEDGDHVEFGGRQTPATTSDMKTRLVNVKGS
ncbi:root phototropism protein 3-like isoform X2 [Cicer arietinum]|uniref:Root phototropism protein 3-like isoform X2 n=1 Tax=Cicer arietinum TaxID=3827 RepID=A0A1S2YM76_CICAR|nr:root phototropism protein 3-like isoform X2 [Cicer arietinum]